MNSWPQALWTRLAQRSSHLSRNSRVARRIAQYQVAARTSLIASLWNRVFGDVDARLSVLEEGRGELDAAIATAQQVAVDRINSVLTPTILLLQRIREKGFMVAHSDTSRTLVVGDTINFTIPDADEAELFEPTTFVSVTREANGTDVAIGRTVLYDKENQIIHIKIVSIEGTAGPHADWIIAATAAFLPMMQDITAYVEAAQDVITTAAADTATDRAAVETAIAALNAAGTGVITINGQAGLVVLDAADVGAVDATTPVAPNISAVTDNSGKVANSKFVQDVVAAAKTALQSMFAGGDVSTLNAAKSYTDSSVGSIAARATTGYVDQKATDAQTAAQAFATAGDVAVLADANDYTDTAITAVAADPNLAPDIRFHAGSL